MTTDKKLIEAAKALLDSGGEDAVTLRAVGAAAGVSHNAPYKHFENRSALLAAVAIADFEMLAAAVRQLRAGPVKSADRMMAALRIVTAYSREHPARYRLLFDDPDIASREGALKAAAMATFGEFLAVTRDAQAAGVLPPIPDTALTGLIFATLHGLIGLQSSGRMHIEKGLAGVEPSLQLLLDLLGGSTRR